eukprot:1967291-Lingulodinium_polyedra.AAC.1
MRGTADWGRGRTGEGLAASWMRGIRGRNGDNRQGHASMADTQQRVALVPLHERERCMPPSEPGSGSRVAPGCSGRVRSDVVLATHRDPADPAG